MNDVVKVLLGIDFGTSTTVLCLQEYAKDGCPIGDVQCLEEIPTVVYKDPEGNCYFGKDAERRYLNQRTGMLYRNFKIGLASADCSESKKLVEEFIKNLFDISRSRMMFYVRNDYQIQTLISVPVKWSAVIKEFMRKAACDAGFGFGLGETEIKVVNEPNAATYAVILPRISDLRANGVLEPSRTSNVMMIDMGAGTTDITIFKLRFNTGIPVIDDDSVHTYPHSKCPVFCGGREIDETLSKYYKETFHSTKSIGTICYRMKTWKEMELSRVVRDNAHTDFDDFCCGGEEMSLTRSQFFDLTNEHWRQWHEIVNGALDDADVRAEDVDLIMLTGGHSNWKPFLEEYFLGTGFCNLAPRNYFKIKNQPKERLLADEDNRSQTVAKGLVLSGCSFPFPNVAEADYWMDSVIGDDGGSGQRIELCKKGSVLPIEKVQKEVEYSIQAGIFRMKSIPVSLSVVRGGDKWSEKLLETKVLVPVTDKLARALIGSIITAVTVVWDIGEEIWKFVTGGSREKTATGEWLADDASSYSLKVKYIFRINDLGSVSGSIEILDEDGKSIEKKTFKW